MSQTWSAQQVTVLAGNAAAITDPAPTLNPVKTGTILVTGMIPVTCTSNGAAGIDNGSFAFVQHSLDGGNTWVPTSGGNPGDQHCFLPGVPAPPGVLANTLSQISVNFIINLPAAVGAPNGVKFRIVLSASGSGAGNGINTTSGQFGTGRGALTAVEIA